MDMATREDNLPCPGRVHATRRVMPKRNGRVSALHLPKLAWNEEMLVECLNDAI